jgi:hypothetical protein
MIALKVERPMTETQVQLKEATVDFIKDLVEQSYYDEDMYIFIGEHGEDTFVQYYEEYVQFGESYNYRAVDTFIEEFGIDNLSSFEDAYRGEWESKADYAENFVTDCYSVDFPAFIEIDWENTFDNLDSVYVNGFVFDTKF